MVLSIQDLRGVLLTHSDGSFDSLARTPIQEDRHQEADSQSRRSPVETQAQLSTCYISHPALFRTFCGSAVRGVPLSCLRCQPATAATQAQESGPLIIPPSYTMGTRGHETEGPDDSDSVQSEEEMEEVLVEPQPCDLQMSAFLYWNEDLVPGTRVVITGGARGRLIGRSAWITSQTTTSPGPKRARRCHAMGPAGTSSSSKTDVEADKRANYSRSQRRSRGLRPTRSRTWTLWSLAQRLPGLKGCRDESALPVLSTLTTLHALGRWAVSSSAAEITTNAGDGPRSEGASSAPPSPRYAKPKSKERSTKPELVESETQAPNSDHKAAPRASCWP